MSARDARPVHVVTDSTSDIPPDLLSGLPITVVPLTVEIGGQSFQDGIDLSREAFLERLKQGQLPRTSQPSIGAFQTIYRELIAQGYNVLGIHIASRFSGTFNSSRAAAESVDPTHVRLVDSGTVSIALGFLVLEAAELAREGRDLASLHDHVQRRREDQRVWAVLDTLEYLQRGGRIGRTSAFLGSALQIKPIVGVRAGEVEPLERVRTFRRAVDRLIAMAQEAMPFDRVAVLHLGAPELAQTIADSIEALQPDTQVVRAMIGTVIGAYGGPGLVGIAGLVKARQVVP